MTRLGLLFSLIFLLSCNDTVNTPFENPNSKDLYKIYLAASDKTSSLESRYELVNEAYDKVRPFTTDSLFSKLLYLKSVLHLYKEEYDSLFIYNKNLEEVAGLNNDDYYLGKSKYLFGYYYSDIVHQSDSAFYYYNQSKNIFLQLQDSSEIGKRFMSMGIIQHDKGDYFGAKESLSDALRYLDPVDDSKFLASTYNELGSNFEVLSDYGSAIEYYLRAIEISPFPKDKLAYKNNLAIAYKNNDELKKAELILFEVNNDSLLIKGSNQEIRVLDNLGYVRWLLAGSDVGTQLKYALEQRKKNNDRRGQLASYMHLGEYNSKKNRKVSKSYLDTLLILSRSLRAPTAEKDGLNLLMSLEPQNIDLRNRYIHLQDSLYQVGLKVKTQFAKMKYDDEQKQLSILKLEAERERKNTELANQRTQKTLWLSLSGFLVLGGISAFYSLRQRHRKEKLQEVYETEKRISKKVHDELANDIYGVMTRMEHSKTFQKENTLDSLEDIYKRTRDISHETGSIDTQNFQDELKKLLSQFRNDDTTIAVKGLSTIKWGGISDEKKITLYRVLNELFVNMKKHSEATLVSVAFENSKKALKIDYSDNGKGVKKSFQKGAGLSNTENRIKNIDGTFSFESELGKGVRIKCAFPI